MNSVVLQLVVIVVAMWFVWKTASLAMRLSGWVLVAIGVLHTADAVTTTITVGTGAILLVVGHVLFFVRKGRWRPRIVNSLWNRRSVTEPESADSHRQRDRHRRAPAR